jgi:uncharacterized membrane protein YcaP (DUF421 family)
MDITWALTELFGGDEPQHPLALHQVAARAAIVYLLGLMALRLGKSRLLSRATALDVLVGFILGSVLGRGITGSASITETFAGSLALVACHWLLTRATYHSHALGKLVKGNCVELVRDGRLDDAMMQRCHISRNDLEELMRLSGVDDVSEIERACKERNGEISIIRRTGACRIVEIQVREGVQTVRVELG